MKKYNICFMFNGQPRFVHEFKKHYEYLFSRWKDNPNVGKIYIRANLWDTIPCKDNTLINVIKDDIEIKLNNTRHINGDDMQKIKDVFSSLNNIVDSSECRIHDQINTLYPYAEKFMDYAEYLREDDPRTEPLVTVRGKVFQTWLYLMGQLYSKFMYHNQVPSDTDLVFIIRTDVLPQNFTLYPLDGEYCDRKIRNSIDLFFTENLFNEKLKDIIYGEKETQPPNIIWPNLKINVNGPHVTDTGCWGLKEAFDIWCRDFGTTIDNYWKLYAERFYKTFMPSDYSIQHLVGIHELHTNIKYNPFNGINPDQMYKHPLHESFHNEFQYDWFYILHAQNIVRDPTTLL